MLASSSNPHRAARLHALIPCAGSGSRAQTATPKQYQPLAGQPLVLHTLSAFAQVSRLASVLVVVAPDDEVLVAVSGLAVARCGGDTRAASVRNGLRELLKAGAHEDDWVLVHDAARCLLTPVMVDALIDACQDDPVGGLLAQPLADTLKQEAQGRSSSTLPREGKWPHPQALRAQSVCQVS